VHGKTKEKIEIVTIDIKHGWKVGTKITFLEMSDEKPDMIPADIVFVIAEKPQTLYTMNDNDILIEQKFCCVCNEFKLNDGVVTTLFWC